MNEWDTDDTPKNRMTLEDMEALIAKLREARAVYKAKKEESDNANTIVQALEHQVIEALEATGRTAFVTQDNARVTLSYAMSVQTPKSTDEKRAFFEWLKEKKGEDVADAYMTVNSNSLNSLYNSLTEEWAARGEVLTIPGLGEPVSRKKLSLRA